MANDDKAAVFDAMVAGYEQYGEPLTRQFAHKALERSGLEPPARILDSGAGAGALAVAAAEAGLDVVAVDLSPGMIHRLGERLAPYPGARAEVMNGENLTFPPATFDAAFSIFGATCFANWHQGLAAMVRAVRPGGQVIVTHWADTHGLAGPARVLADVLTATFPDRPPAYLDSALPAHTKESLAEDLTSAGCTAVEFEELTAVSRWPEPHRIVDELEAVFRYLPAYAALNDADRKYVRGPIEDGFARYAESDGRVLISDTVNLTSGHIA